MLARITTLAALAVVAGTQLMPDAAEARGRFCLPFGFLCQDAVSRDLYADEYGDQEYYEDERPLTYFEPDDDDYDSGYDGEEPVYISPKKKKPAKVAKRTLKKSVALTKKKAASSTKTHPMAVADKKAATSAEKKTAKSSIGVSCNKAETIVSGYGFTNVKPTTCAGQIFAFNATRSGKAYVIKLSSASGELTEVKKVQ